MLSCTQARIEKPEVQSWKEGNNLTSYLSLLQLLQRLGTLDSLFDSLYTLPDDSSALPVSLPSFVFSPPRHRSLFSVVGIARARRASRVASKVFRLMLGSSKSSRDPRFDSEISLFPRRFGFASSTWIHLASTIRLPRYVLLLST